MSLLLCGLTECAICRRVIEAGLAVVQFPAFVLDQADPLVMFNDASVHADCYQAHPLRDKVEAVISEHRARTGPGHRWCAVCGDEIFDWNNYLLVPRLTSDPMSPLARFNFTHFHRSHVREWKDLGLLMSLLAELDRSGVWKGGFLRALIQEIEVAGGGA